MGSIFEICRGVCDDNNREFFIISSQSPNNSFINSNKKQESKQKKINKFIPYHLSNEIIINTNNETAKNINSYNNSGNENELSITLNKMSQMIESLEYKNKILEKEKKEIKEEKEKLEKELQICRNKTLIKRINSIKSSDNKELKNSTINVGEKINLTFIFKDDKNIDNNINGSKEELIAYKNEMFIEVKLRLLNIRQLGPRYIKMCYYNSKEINDWFTLEELNIIDNSQIICEIT